jgi:hypothetical protein
MLKTDRFPVGFSKKQSFPVFGVLPFMNGTNSVKDPEYKNNDCA